MVAIAVVIASVTVPPWPLTYAIVTHKVFTYDGDRLEVAVSETTFIRSSILFEPVVICWLLCDIKLKLESYDVN